MKHRLFIAIDIPSTEIVTLQSRLDRLHLPLVLEPPEKLHITLHFLGSIPADQISSIKTLMGKIVLRYSSFSLQPTFLETLYRRHAPSLVYLGLTDDLDVLKDLQKSLSLPLSKLLLPHQERFFPHVTIAKFKPDDPVQIKNFLSKISDFEFSPLTPFVVSRVTLYESHLSRTGSHFQKISQFSLHSDITP